MNSATRVRIEFFHCSMRASELEDDKRNKQVEQIHEDRAYNLINFTLHDALIWDVLR